MENTGIYLSNNQIMLKIFRNYYRSIKSSISFINRDSIIVKLQRTKGVIMRKNYMNFLVISTFTIMITITILGLFFEYPFEKNIDPYLYLNQYKYHFIAIIPKEKDLHWGYLKEGIKKADEDFNIVTEILEVENSREQLQALKMAISSEVDGIIISPMGDQEYAIIINKAAEKGIPIVTVVTDVPNSKRSSFIGENMNSNYMAGLEFVSAVQEKVNVVVLLANETSTTFNERLEGFQKAIRDNENIDILMIKEIDNDLLHATQNIQQLLIMNPQANAIFCISPKIAIAAARAIERLDRKNTLIMGYDDYPDTLHYIEENNIYGVITQKSDFIGYVAVRYLQDISHGRWVPEILDPGIQLITKENIQQYKKRRGVSQ